MLLQSTFADWAGGFAPAGGRYMLPLAFCILPAVAFLYLASKWLGKMVMVTLIIAQSVLGVYNVHMDYRWSYAGMENPLFATLQQYLDLGLDLAAPIFSHDLDLNGATAALELGGEVSIVLNVFLLGMVLAGRRVSTATSVTPELESVT
jgi:hypothetical protein